MVSAVDFEEWALGACSKYPQCFWNDRDCRDCIYRATIPEQTATTVHVIRMAKLRLLVDVINMDVPLCLSLSKVLEKEMSDLV